MSQLAISLLGSFQVTLGGQPVTGFKSNKVRALLAYLAVERDRPHRREALAGLLWPDWPDRDALSNLRYALSDLRRVIGDRAAEPSFLLITRNTLQLNVASDVWLDVAAFLGVLEADRSSSAFIERCEGVSTLYRGSFLEGFYVGDSPAFEDWMLFTRERLTRQASLNLHTLIDAYEKQGKYERAQIYAWQQLELEPWNETAHRQLMRVLALSGQRSAALAQYEACRSILAKELEVEPSEETKKINEQIREGKLEPAPVQQTESSPGYPSFLEEKNAGIDAYVFVARERELAQLGELLDQAISGNGSIVFVTGEAGSGKTSLVHEFTRRAQETHADLLVASGNCNAYTGIGDPYLPFREILELLTGDVESRWAAGAIAREHALRLWKNLPVVAKVLVEAGPDLIDTFIQRSPLLERAKLCVSGRDDRLTRLDEFLDRKPLTVLSSSALYQIDLFEQYTRVLQGLERQSPLLLVIDDLQWADAGSINLLFHIGRRIAGNRILLLGSYRSEEVALGRAGGRHPLEAVVNELRRKYGDILINLGNPLSQDEGREFVTALLDSELNRMDESFREMLFQQTQGHPLFTIELLRGLQDRGDIFKDSEGYWIAGPSLDWDTLPVRVEAAVQERISRLPEGLQKVLELASIEGELFTAEVVARVRGMNERDLLENLSGELDRKHRLVRAQSIQRVNNRLLSRYQFRHILFQKFLYGSLDEVVRVHFHEQVGTALEDLYGRETEVGHMALHLALHFEIARIDEKAVRYLYLSGQKAMQLSAYQEVISHATKALELIENIPESNERDKQEINLQLHLILAMALQGAKGAQIYEIRNAYLKARELCERMGKKSELVQVLGGLAIFSYVRAEYHIARGLAEEALSLAETICDPLLLMLCHWYLGFILFCLGDFSASLHHLREVTDVYDPKKHHKDLVQLRGSDAGLGAMAYETCCLWCLGYPDQALKRSRETFDIGRKLAHPFSLADVICFSGCLFHSMSRDVDSLATEAESLMRLADASSMAGWLATGLRYRGEALVLQGANDSVRKLKEGMDAMQSEEVRLYFTGSFAHMVEAHLKAGFLDEARASLDEAFAFIEETDERYWEAELFRLKGDLLLADNQIASVEACLNKALEIARKQKAKSLELRTAISLSRLWAEKGKRSEAHQLLSEIFNWFTEGFDTPDLLAAKELLDSLQP